MVTEIPGRKILNGESVYTDWGPRGGDGLILRVEVIDGYSPAEGFSVLVKVLTKSSETTGDGTQVGSTLTVFAVTNGVSQLLIKPTNTVGMNELVRLSISTSSGATGDWLQLRIFPLVFYEAAQVGA